MTTTIVPSLGHAPLVTQTGVGTSPGYDAIDIRRLASAGLQEGVMAASSFQVTQRGAGANMSVDIAASTGDAATGVAAYVQGDAVTAQSLYPVAPHSAVINETVTTAHATLPRVDSVVLEVLDNTHDASGSNLARVRVVAGTATSGATLDNRTGAPSLPSSALLLADVLIAGGATSIANSVIRDRRKWARGAYCRIVRTAGDYTIATNILAYVDSTNLRPRIECSGAPLRITLQGVMDQQTDGANAFLVPQIDGVGVDGAVSIGGAASSTNTVFAHTGASASGKMPSGLSWVTIPSAGSHLVSMAWGGSSGTLTLKAQTTAPLLFVVEELIRQNTANNTTTTG